MKESGILVYSQMFRTFISISQNQITSGHHARKKDLSQLGIISRTHEIKPAMQAIHQTKRARGQIIHINWKEKLDHKQGIQAIIEKLAAEM